MRQMWQALRLIWSAAPRAMWRGAALSICVLAMGAALLGVSGWFITATGLAGLAGIGIAFDVFRPSAAIRFLALGRAGARYGERLLTHDATLRALSALRVHLLRRQARSGFEAMQRLRGSLALSRITADVDALDGIVLRLALPVLAGVLVHLGAFAALWWLVMPAVAGAVTAGYLLGGGAVLVWLAIVTLAPSARAEDALQALRRGAIDMLRGRADLLVHGRVQERLARIAETDTRARAAQAALDRAERAGGLMLSGLVAAICAAALAMAGAAVVAGGLDPAAAAIGFFVALALAETVLPLRRGVAEAGRIRVAAQRVLGGPAPAAETGVHARPPTDGNAPALRVRGLSFRRAGARHAVYSGVSFDVAAGETVALSAPSGAGKSTLLAQVAALLPVEAGAVRVLGCAVGDWPETELRRVLAFVPQRSALISGTVFDNLALARAEVSRAEAMQALEAVSLRRVIEDRGGLDARLGEGGAGLSGGESRRLVLARALLRQPKVLLLDEPTEGLDSATARAVLDGLRGALPQAAIVMASHRAEERGAADRVVSL
ncbi:amino acid ABC transporter ATP-binding/permease protein [Roseovarius salinarum]|uniref:amino acid ABC transporter ATP-binding/permease protein n=1 Tax=Roseovarius salinarum TaxID=1981892 RepID=UPI000C320F04|nr:ATP-binding cassette domain-containing protein [Roseovarius salinarum]